MAKDTFDRILTSVPLNSTAGRVTSRGAHYDPKIKTTQRAHSDIPTHSDAPSKCVPFRSTDPGAIDLTSRKFGRMTVIGYLGRLNPKNGKKGSWLVRCVCGNYETRMAAGIKKANEEDCCGKCRAWRTTEMRYKKHGSRPIEDFTK